MLDPDTPPWLGQLDQGRFVQAKTCQESPETTSYLIEMRLVGGHVGTLQARIDHARNDSLTNYFVTDDSIDAMGGILVAVTRRRGPEYTRGDPEAAIGVVTRAIERYDAEPFEREPANPWPTNRPLLDFALSHFVLAAA